MFRASFETAYKRQMIDPSPRFCSSCYTLTPHSNTWWCVSGFQIWNKALRQADSIIERREVLFGAVCITRETGTGKQLMFSVKSRFQLLTKLQSFKFAQEKDILAFVFCVLFIYLRTHGSSWKAESERPGQIRSALPPWLFVHQKGIPPSLNELFEMCYHWVTFRMVVSSSALQPSHAVPCGFLFPLHSLQAVRPP